MSCVWWYMKANSKVTPQFSFLFHWESYLSLDYFPVAHPWEWFTISIPIFTHTAKIYVLIPHQLYLNFDSFFSHSKSNHCSQNRSYRSSNCHIINNNLQQCNLRVFLMGMDGRMYSSSFFVILWKGPPVKLLVTEWCFVVCTRELHSTSCIGR